MFNFLRLCLLKSLLSGSESLGQGVRVARALGAGARELHSDHKHYSKNAKNWKVKKPPRMQKTVKVKMVHQARK
jgi:hypothetical protein